MESIAHVASVFCIEFHTNRNFRTAQSPTIFSIIFEWFNWHRFIWGTLAMVSARYSSRSTCESLKCHFVRMNNGVLLCHHSRSCFLTSSLIGTIGVTLQIPLSMLFDVIFKNKTFSAIFYIGTIPMCASLLFVGFLMKNEDSDPLLRFMKIVYRKLCACRRPNIVR